MTKKKWIRPECTRIKLVPEEAVLTGCKTHLSAGPGGGICMGYGNGACHQAKS
ncbi:MAG: hypothetical protein P8Z71_03765 [Candidatus Sulfobium sp.]